MVLGYGSKRRKRKRHGKLELMMNDMVKLVENGNLCECGIEIRMRKWRSYVTSEKEEDEGIGMAELARETGLRRGRVVVMILMITHFLIYYYIRFFFQTISLNV